MIDSADISKVNSYLNEAKRILISKGLSDERSFPVSDRCVLEVMVLSLPPRQYKLLKAILDWEVEKLSEHREN